MADCVATSTLIIVENHLALHIFALTDLRAILQTVGLLDKKHVPVVLRGLHNLRASSSVVHIHTET